MPQKSRHGRAAVGAAGRPISGKPPRGGGAGDAPFGVLAKGLYHFLHAALHLLVLGGCGFGSSGGRARESRVRRGIRFVRIRQRAFVRVVVTASGFVLEGET